MQNTLRPVPRHPIKTPVTLIVGIICEDGIVVASDGQTSFTTSGTAKRTDAHKIKEVLFEEGSALVAQAGSVPLAGRAIEIFEKLSRGESMSDYMKPAYLLQRSVMELKQELKVIQGWDNINQSEAKLFFDNYDFDLLVAYYHQRKTPYLYGINFSLGVSQRHYRYATLGCGSTVAEYLLNGMDFERKEWTTTAGVAIYTVEEVKKVDAFCGGPTRLGIVWPTEIQIKSPAMIESIARKLEVQGAPTKAAWQQSIESMVLEAVLKDPISKK